MTHPQEKLAALAQRAIPFLRDEGAKYEDDGSNEPLELARDIEQALSEHGEVVVTTDQAGRCVAVTRQDGEGRILSTIWETSEHGGGGEAVAWLANDGTGRVIDAKAKDAARRAGGATASAMAAYTIPLHPPTPSAPVVDNWSVIVEGLRLADQFFDGDDHHWEWDNGETFPAGKVRAAYRAALSGVSAPVGVEEIVEAITSDSFTMTDTDTLRRVAAALTPAAAPRVEDDGMCYCQGPDVVCDNCAASEDGLQADLAYLRNGELLDRDARTNLRAIADRIERRLAASGQGAEGWKLVPANATNNMQIAGLAALDESDATPDSIGHLIGYKAIREAYAAMIAAAPTQEGK